MKKGRPQIIALDVDDVLFDCLRKAVGEAQKRGCDITFGQITDYHFGNLPKKTGELLLEIMQEPDFYLQQTAFRAPSIWSTSFSVPGMR